MEKLYLMWGLLLFFFVIVFVVKSVKEGRAMKPHEPAMDPMFRRHRPRTGNRPSSDRHRAAL